MFGLTQEEGFKEYIKEKAAAGGDNAAADKITKDASAIKQESPPPPVDHINNAFPSRRKPETLILPS